MLQKCGNDSGEIEEHSYKDDQWTSACWEAIFMLKLEQMVARLQTKLVFSLIYVPQVKRCKHEGDHGRVLQIHCAYEQLC